MRYETIYHFRMEKSTVFVEGYEKIGYTIN
jgi:hypothetical protein